MADTSGTTEAGNLNHELEQQRQFASRLRQEFAAALRAAGPQSGLRHAAQIAAGVGKQPATAIAAAFLAGYLVGRALRSR